MHIFHQNLLNYNANTQDPAGGVPTPKQGLITAELGLYQANYGNVDIAGFTEVFVANGATQANIESALNNLGASLGIPTDGAGNRNLAVIRCGRSALQNSNEVVGIVLDGNATNITYYVDSFETNGGPPTWSKTTIPSAGNFTSYLQLPADWMPDYRYPVVVDYDLGGNSYSIGFIHNRRPSSLESAITLGYLRTYIEGFAPENGGEYIDPCTLLGGDFNTTPDCLTANPCTTGGHHPLTFYSILANTTIANNYDWWMSNGQPLQSGGANATCNATPTVPPTLAGTGSDHRGVGIDID
ncbi:MAG: hypothetical protein ACSHX0_12570 [Akkermansiaceae bacterium]